MSKTSDYYIGFLEYLSEQCDYTFDELYDAFMESEPIDLKDIERRAMSHTL